MTEQWPDELWQPPEESEGCLHRISRELMYLVVLILVLGA